jgi:hypothetical protein
MLHLTIRAISDAAFREHGLVMVHEWRDITGSVCAYGYVGAGARWMRWPGFAVFRFEDEGQVDAFPERQVDPSRILDLFHRTVEPLALQALGWETLHASAVLTPRGLLGFCGECESGKSTIAYSLSRRGYRQHADDSVVFQMGPLGVRALDLPFGVRLRPEAATFFGFTADERPLQDVVPIARHGADRVATQPLSALFVLTRKSGGEPTVEQIASSEAFRVLLPHARCFDVQSADDRRRLLQHYLDLAAAVPVYDLRFPRGLDRLPAVLDCIESTLELTQAEPV